MASLDSVQQKLYRASVLFKELTSELSKYHESPNGEWRQTGLDSDATPIYEYRAREPVPARFGLIFGECLQCMRSSLDYLIWELVLAAGGTPDRLNMFPVALNQKDYDHSLSKRHRLDGLTDAMKAEIYQLQPLLEDDPAASVLAVLDDLAIINRHRRVILTSLTAVAEEPIFPFPRRSEIVRVWGDDGEIWGEKKFWIYIAIQEGPIQNLDVAVLLEVIMRYIIDRVLPRFEQFF